MPPAIPEGTPPSPTSSRGRATVGPIDAGLESVVTSQPGGFRQRRPRSRADGRSSRAILARVGPARWVNRPRYGPFVINTRQSRSSRRCASCATGATVKGRAHASAAASRRRASSAKGEGASPADGPNK